MQSTYRNMSNAMSKKVSNTKESAILLDSENSPQCRILKAARELFFSKGVAAVTTDMLVKKAKTSKMTLYKYFANKDELLAEVVAGDVSRITASVNAPITTQSEFTNAVFQFCSNLSDTIFDAEIVRFDQLMVSQALSHEELTRSYYNKTYQPTIDNLTALIAKGQQKGFVSTQFEPELLCDMLISSVSGLAYTKALHGFTAMTDKKDASDLEQTQKRLLSIIHIIINPQ